MKIDIMVGLVLRYSTIEVCSGIGGSFKEEESSELIRYPKEPYLKSPVKGHVKSHLNVNRRSI